MNIAEIFLRGADGAAIKLVKQGGGCLIRSRREVYRRARRLCGYLEAAGIGPHDKVLILTGTDVTTAEILLAVFNAGAVAVPLDPLAGAESLLRCAQALRPAAVLYERRLPDTLLCSLTQHPCLLVQAGEAQADSEPRHRDAGGCLYLEDILAAGPPETPLRNHAPDTPALLIHTSGSEGRPKVIRMSHRNLVDYFHYHDIVYRQYFVEAEPDRPVVSVYPFSHLAGVTTCFQGLLMGRTSILLRRFEPRLFLETLAREKVGFFTLVSSMFAHLLKEEALLQSLDLSSLEVCAAIGEPCPPALIEKVQQKIGVPLLVGYGLTECVSGIAHRREDILAGSIPAGSCGKVLFPEVRLVDGEGRENARQGRLWIRNPTVHRCYTEESLNDAMLEDGWYKTRDIFRRDEDGNFYHLGRADDMFIVNGKNMYPRELEAVLLRHPDVSQACVLPLVVDGRVAAGAVIMGSKGLTEQEVMDYLIENASAHILPRRLWIVGEIPSLGPGKMDRQACLELLEHAP